MDHSSDDTIGNETSSPESTNGNDTSSSSSLSVLSGSTTFERPESSTRTSVQDHGTLSSMGDDQMWLHNPNFPWYPEYPYYPSNNPNPNPSAPLVSNPREEKVVNLREWLETKELASKADLVGLFREIVMLVHGFHQQGMVLLDLRPSMFDLKGDGVVYLGRVTRNNARKRGLGEGPSGEFAAVNHENYMENKSTVVADHMEKEWYAFPEEFENNDLAYCNIHCLELLLFEFLSHFERIEEYNEAMMCLHHRNLPPEFFSWTYKEAQCCSWLLLPEPSSYPTTREILESNWLCELESAILSTGEDSGNADEADPDLLLDVLLLSKQRHESEKLKLLEQIKMLDFDIKLAEKACAVGKYLRTENKDNPESSTSRKNVLRSKLQENFSQLETAYFSLCSNATVTGRTDVDVLKCQETWSWTRAQPDPRKPAYRVEALYDGIRKLARGNKFEFCGMLKNGGMLNPNNKAICSLCFDRDEEYFAAAGPAKKIEIYEMRSFLDDDVDVQYPVVEMTNESMLSCISWNTYITNHLVSSDYEGLVKMWDTNTGQSLSRYKEHQKKVCSVDFCGVEPGKFASGGADCSVRIWNTDERKSVGAIWNRASVCCVQFSAYSSHILAYAADDEIYVYDLRNPRIPWCTLRGHEGSVSCVRFLGSDTIVSASVDSTLKLWDLKKTSSRYISTDACGLTFSGHTNRKSIVGMAVMDGYIASGSETDEVYAYYKSLPLPISIHKLKCFDSTFDAKIIGSAQHTISSLCWRKKSQMLVAGNSAGNINILRMV